MELFAIASLEKQVPLGAYANLIKASWILVDIVARQVSFLATSKHSDVQLLSAELKNELSSLTFLKLEFPGLDEHLALVIPILSLGILWGLLPTFAPKACLMTHSTRL